MPFFRVVIYVHGVPRLTIRRPFNFYEKLLRNKISDYIEQKIIYQKNCFCAFGGREITGKTFAFH